MAAEFRIRVKVDPADANRGTSEVGKGLSRLQAQANAVQRSIQQAIAFAGIGAAVTQLYRLTEAYIGMQNRIRTVTTSTAQLAVVQERLENIARRSYTSLNAVTELYTRMARAASDLGRSQEEVLQFTESLSKEVKLSGASATEAAAGIIQLSQGLASGALRGDELRSVLEQIPTVADVIAQHLGVTRGELRQMGQEGRITADIVLDAFAAARDEIDERFRNAVVTAGDAFIVLGDSLTTYVGRLNESINANEGLRDILLWVADNIDTLARVAFAALIFAMIQLATVAIPMVIRAFVALTAAIASNPIGAIAVAITATISLLAAFSDQLIVSADGITTLADVAGAAWDIMAQSAGDAFMDILRDLGIIKEQNERTTNGMTDDWMNTVQEWAYALDNFIREAIIEFQVFGVAVGNILKTVATMGTYSFDEAIADTRAAGDRIRSNTPALPTNIGGYVFRTLEEARSRSRNRQANQGLEEAAMEEALRQLRESGTNRTGGAEDDASRSRTTFRDLITDLQNYIDLLGMSNQQREIQSGILSMEERLKRSLTEEERKLAEQLLSTVIQLEAQAEALDEIRGPSEEYLRRIEALNALLGSGRITQEEYTRSLREARLAFLETQDTLGAGIERAFLKYQQEAENVGASIEQALSGAFQQAEDALVEMVMTGKAEFGDLFRYIAEQFIRMGIQQIIAQIMGAANGGGKGGGGGGIGSFLQYLPMIFGFAKGGIMGPGGPLALRTYASGGVANSPQLAMFGEGSRPEAYVPLPDGRNIPVKMENEGSAGPAIVIEKIEVDARGASDPAEVDARVRMGITEAVPAILEAAGAKSKAVVNEAFSRRRL